VPALSTTERVPLCDPVALGVKVTEMVQLSPGSRLDPQSLVSAKLPEALMLVSVSVSLLLLGKFTDKAALVVLIG
jgi:hypothetical protein